MTLQVNGLDDKTLTRKLYEAAAAGVRIDAIVRGICRLRAGALASDPDRPSQCQKTTLSSLHGALFKNYVKCGMAAQFVMVEALIDIAAQQVDMPTLDM